MNEGYPSPLGHKSHHPASFGNYCRRNNMVTLCVLHYCPYFLQPLDVECFGPLEVSYGKQIEQMMRLQIAYIMKDDFSAAFSQAFKASFTPSSLQTGFKATGLISYNPESVLVRLDIMPVTPSLPISRSGNPNFWVTQAPHHPSRLICSLRLPK